MPNVSYNEIYKTPDIVALEEIGKFKQFILKNHTDLGENIAFL